MSVRNLIAGIDTATVNVTEFCKDHGIDRSTFYRLKKRVHERGLEGLEPQSRAPRRVANKTPGSVEDEVVKLRKELVDEGVDAGPLTIHYHLGGRLDPSTSLPSTSTIWRMLRARGLIDVSASKPRRRRWRSFSADRANECWQADSTHWELADGSPVEIIDVIDDCTRLAVGSRAVRTTTTTAIWAVLVAGALRWGWPQRLLRDNGSPYKALAPLLGAFGIASRHSRPYHPQTCGKVERFHQTLKLYLAAHGPFETIEELQGCLDRFVEYYNAIRPHRSLARQTPLSVWESTPKSGPSTLPLDQPTRLYHGVVRAGRLPIPSHAIAVGASLDGTPAGVLVTGDRCHIVADDGRVLRQLTIDRTRYYQPLHDRPGRPSREAQ